MGIRSLPKLIIKVIPTLFITPPNSKQSISTEEIFLQKILDAMQATLRDKLEREESIQSRAHQSKAIAQKKPILKDFSPQTKKNSNPAEVSLPSVAKKTIPIVQSARRIVDSAEHRRKMAEGGFTYVSPAVKSTPSKCEFSASPFSMKDRITRWDFSAFNCDSPQSSREDFLTFIRSFSDRNAEGSDVNRYANMSKEHLKEQYRRHYIPRIETLLADKYFLETYGQKIPFPNEERNQTSYLFLVQDIQVNTEGKTEILSIGITECNEQKILHHCFIHPAKESIPLTGSIKNHFFGNEKDALESTATQVVHGNRRENSRIVQIEREGKLPLIEAHCIDPFSMKSRKVVFYPLTN